MNRLHPTQLYLEHLLFGLVITLLIFFPFLTVWSSSSWLFPAYRLFNIMMFAVWLLVTISLNLLIGYSGQISLGHAALVLLGGYLTAMLRQGGGLPIVAALLLAGIINGVLGASLIGQSAVRLRGPYLGIATFALAIALPQLLKLKLIVPWTKGVRGIHSSPLLLPANIKNFLMAEHWRYFIVLLIVFLMAAIFKNLISSRIGRAFLALREDELAAASMGVNIRHYKTLAFGISAFYAGVGGGLFFFVQGYVSPDSLGVFDSILFLVAVVIGGLGSLAGCIAGAIFLSLQSEVISGLIRLIPNAQQSGSMIFGLLLLSATLLFPQGIAGFVKGQWRR